MAVTKENCKFVGGLSAVMGMLVLVMSTVFFNQCLNFHKRYAPTSHLQTEVTKKNYNWLITIGMIGIFGGVAQFLMSLTMYWGVDKKITEYSRIYLFCFGETITLLLLLPCLTIGIVCKAYSVTKGLLNKNYELNFKILENDDKQVANWIGLAFCLILALDLFALIVSLLYLGFNLRRRKYDEV